MPEKAKTDKKAEQKPKEPVKPTKTPKQQFEDFKNAIPGAYMKICPAFCLFIGCPHVKECWELKTPEERSIEKELK